MSLFESSASAQQKLYVSNVVPMHRAIHQIMRNTLGGQAQQIEMGIVIRSMRTGKVLYQQNAQRLLTPASLLKLFTMVTALDYLGPTFRFKTQLLTNGRVTHHSLKGDLFLKFEGDPHFSEDQLITLLQSLHRRGIDDVRGRLYILVGAYDQTLYPPGVVVDDLSYSYAAPLMASIINRNAFSISLDLMHSPHRSLVIRSHLPLGIVHFSKNLRIVKTIHPNCPITVYSHSRNDYALNGCYYDGGAPTQLKLAIRDVRRYVKMVFVHALRAVPIRFQGLPQFKREARKLFVLAEHRSEPLKDIVKDTLKESDNLSTNSVLKKMGERYFNAQGTWKNGLNALKTLLSKKMHIHFQDSMIDDGAGLSRYDLISPCQLSQLLYFAYHRQSIRKYLWLSLPIAGVDGTLAHRLRDQRKNRRIHLKTGRLTGVSGLAGYIHTKHLGDITLVMMTNHFNEHCRAAVIAMENNFCRYLVNAHASR